MQRIAGNGTGDTRWKVPGVLDWSTGIYNPRVDITKDTTTLYASDRDVFLFLVDDLNPIEAGRLPDGSPDLYFRGFYCWNSEVGAKTLGIASFYLRAVCQNRNLWGVEDFEEITIRHSKYAASRFAHEAAPALTSFANSSPMPFVNGIKAARERIVARTDEDRTEFLRKRGFSKAETAQDHRDRAGGGRPPARKHLRFRAGHHRRRARQAAPGCPARHGGARPRSCSIGPPDSRQPELRNRVSRSFVRFPLFLSSASRRCPLEEEGGAALRDGLEAEREALGRPSRRNSHGKSRSEDHAVAARATFPSTSSCSSQSNVRRVKAGVSIEELAEDIARRGLLQSLNVRPVLDDAGAETGMFEVPAGGRRYRALELLVKQKRLAKTAPVPCIVRDRRHRRGGLARRERPARAAASARPVPRLPDAAREGPVRGGDRGRVLRLASTS